MEPIEFAIHLSAVEHPCWGAILELASNKFSHQKS